jgi:DNA-binding transcriptional LysR family regulator
VFEDRIYIVAGANNPRVRRRKTGQAQKDRAGRHCQASLDFAPYGRVTDAFIEKLFRSQGIEPPVAAVTCGSIEMHTALLGVGSFLAMYPRSVLEFSLARSSFKVLPFECPIQPPPVGILTWKGRTTSPACRLFIQRFREVAAPLIQKAKRPAKFRGLQ